MEQRYAIIDIGSNSVRYLGADGNKQLITTRLAGGLIDTGALREEAMGKSLLAVETFVRLAQGEGLMPCAYATSAVRDAKNAAVFLKALRERCGIEADVLSGEREADYAVLGAGAEEGGLVDVGGGSSQMSFSGYRASFPLGCVRAKDLIGEETSFEGMREKLAHAAGGIFRFPRIYIDRWTGVGGTVTTLAALSLGLVQYNKEAVNACLLTREMVEQTALALHGAGAAARAAHPLLHDRHDVIVPGALVLLMLMQGMAIEALRVSDADGMEGYLSYLHARDAAQQK